MFRTPKWTERERHRRSTIFLYGLMGEERDCHPCLVKSMLTAGQLIPLLLHLLLKVLPVRCSRAVIAGNEVALQDDRGTETVHR